MNEGAPGRLFHSRHSCAALFFAGAALCYRGYGPAQEDYLFLLPNNDPINPRTNCRPN